MSLYMKGTECTNESAVFGVMPCGQNIVISKLFSPPVLVSSQSPCPSGKCMRESQTVT